jgi:hypothetical protein
LDEHANSAIDSPTTGSVSGSPAAHFGVANDTPETQPLARHHPVIGYQYNPGTRRTFSRPGGGTVQINVNAAGLRSDREYSLAKPLGVLRILVFGDSQAGGFFQPNERRFTELIERRNPGVEVINFALPASGTDQQLLLFEEIGRTYEHDLVILLPYLASIYLNLRWEVIFIPVLFGPAITKRKPRFVLTTRADGTEVLELHNCPIPEEPPAAVAGNAVDRAAESNRHGRNTPGRPLDRNMLNPVRLARTLFDLVGFDPYPLLFRFGFDRYHQYATPNTEGWRLMEAIIRRFAKASEPKPFVLAPIVDSSYMRFKMRRNYWRRFSSLSDGERVHVIDLLPHFLKLGPRATECYMEPHDNHLSDFGHSVLADAVEAELTRLALLTVRKTECRASE